MTVRGHHLSSRGKSHFDLRLVAKLRGIWGLKMSHLLPTRHGVLPGQSPIQIYRHTIAERLSRRCIACFRIICLCHAAKMAHSFLETDSAFPDLVADLKLHCLATD